MGEGSLVQIISNTCIPRAELEHVITHLPKTKVSEPLRSLQTKTRADQKPLAVADGKNSVKSVVDDLWHPICQQNACADIKVNIYHISSKLTCELIDGLQIHKIHLQGKSEKKWNLY